MICEGITASEAVERSQQVAKALLFRIKEQIMAVITSTSYQPEVRVRTSLVYEVMASVRCINSADLGFVTEILITGLSLLNWQLTTRNIIHSEDLYNTCVK